MLHFRTLHSQVTLKLHSTQVLEWGRMRPLLYHVRHKNSQYQIRVNLFSSKNSSTLNKLYVKNKISEYSKLNTYFCFNIFILINNWLNCFFLFFLISIMLGRWIYFTLPLLSKIFQYIIQVFILKSLIILS